MVFISLLFTSCHDPFSFNGSPATLTITIGGSGARSGFPSDFDPEGLSHTIQLFDAQGELLYEELDVIYGQTITFSVIPGYYDFLVIARNDDEVKEAVGVANRTIRSGRNEAVDITMQFSGNGTDDFPFLVYSAEGLSSVGKNENEGDFVGWELGSHYRQIANINLARIEGSWVPIGNQSTPFAGVYDGGGFIIENLTISGNQLNEQGLFGRVNANDAYIRNIGLVNVDIEITNATSVGGIAGYLFRGTIESCYVTGNINGHSDVGGIVGNGSDFRRIENCYFIGNVSGSDNIGGIAGDTNREIRNCYVSGNIFGSGDNVGGIAGINRNSGFVIGCYVTANVEGMENVGGIVGMNQSRIRGCVALNGRITSDTANIGRITSNEENSAFFPNNYARSDLILRTLLNDNLDGIDVNASLYTQEAFWRDLWNSDFDDIWEWNPSARLPILKNVGGQQNPRVAPIDGILPDSFRITRDDGFSFINTVPIYTTLTVVYNGSGSVSYEWFNHDNISEGREKTFKPTVIGEYKLIIRIGLSEIEVPFTATEGSGEYNDPFIVYDVESLIKVGTEEAYGVLALSAYYRQVANIDLEGEDWTPICSDETSTFCGIYDGGGFEIRNLTINDSNLTHAGLFGYIHSGGAAVKNLGLVDVYITANSYVGGIAGFIASGSIENCYVTGTMTVGSSSSNNTSYAGGIVGSSDGSRITNCWTNVNITATGTNVGGIVGETYAACYIENCYALGDVVGSDQVGGIVGYLRSSTITNCVALNSLVAATTSTTTTPPTGRAGRITGDVDFAQGGTHIGNRARSDLIPMHSYNTTTGIGTNITIDNTFYATGKNGQNVDFGPANTQYNNQNFWQNTLGWVLTQTGSWQWNASAELPELRGMKNTQNPQVNPILPIGTLSVTWGNGETSNSRAPIYTTLTAAYQYSDDVSSYEWRNASDTVGTNSTFRTESTGDYTLTVTLINGRTVSVQFTTDLGSGTPTDPFIVHDVATLQGIIAGNDSIGVHYRQVKKIELTVPVEQDGSNFTRIGNGTSFRGTYNGGGFSIENIRMRGLTAADQGLFGMTNGATISNVSLVNAVITGSSNCVGGIVGYNQNSIVENCYVQGEISGSNTIGGIVGVNTSTSSPGSTVKNSYFEGTVSGSQQVGGIVGSSNGSRVENCYATGVVSGSQNVGGIAGENVMVSTILNCVALNTSITTTGNNTSLARVAGVNNGTLTNNHACSEIELLYSYNVSQSNGTPYTPTPGANLKDGATVEPSQYTSPEWWSTLAPNGPGWNFQTIWEWDTETNLPKLKQGGNQ